MRRAFTATLGATAAVALVTATAAAGRPFVAERETMQRHTLGADRFDLWVCEVPGDSTANQWEGCLTGSSSSPRPLPAPSPSDRWSTSA